jgi:hypothetical protein
LSNSNANTNQTDLVTNGISTPSILLEDNTNSLQLPIVTMPTTTSTNESPVKSNVIGMLNDSEELIKTTNKNFSR